MIYLRLVMAAAAVLTAAAAATAVLSPKPRNPRIDPALRLEASTTVPADVASILRNACVDCHSDETRWPWYSTLPPVSWLVAHDVEEGRSHMNFSRWGDYNPFDRADMLDEACELVTSGEMPLAVYRLLHRPARLSESDVKALCAWSRGEAERLAQGGN